MLLPRIEALLLVATTAQAFKNASPFFMLSSSPLQTSSEQIATTDKLRQRVLDDTRECACDLYILVQQPGLSAADLQRRDAMPNMRRRVMAADEGKVVQIPSVIGEIDITSLSTRIARNCGADEVPLDEVVAVMPTWFKENKVVASIIFDPLPTDDSERQRSLRVSDDVLEQLFREIPSELSWMLVYTSTPASSSQATVDPQLYEMDEPYPSALHQDLKRDLGASAQTRRSNDTDNAQATLPLFEKYQFLSPGIFMGLSVSLLLLLILWVGVSAIAGLEVSYMAFSKEMGPQVQNKGKQQ